MTTIITHDKYVYYLKRMVTTMKNKSEWKNNEYNRGLINGMLLAIATLTNEEANFLNASSKNIRITEKELSNIIENDFFVHTSREENYVDKDGSMFKSEVVISEHDSFLKIINSKTFSYTPFLGNIKSATKENWELLNATLVDDDGDEMDFNLFMDKIRIIVPDKFYDIKKIKKQAPQYTEDMYIR